MQISARNQFTGTVVAVREGAVNGVVTIDLGPALVKAGITMEAIRELGLTEGMQATAIAAASDVLFARGNAKLPISVPNQFVGVVTRVEHGAVNGIVEVACADGICVTGTVTNESIDELGLAEGVEAVAIVKSVDVLVSPQG